MATGSPTIRRRRLGQLLRKFRTDAGLTGEDVAAQLERSDSWVSRLEAGRTGLRVRDLHALLDLYGIHDPDIRTELEDLARQGRQRGWWSAYASVLSEEYAAYIGFEESAVRLLAWQSLVVDGLLQTEDYARAVMRIGAPGLDQQTVDRRVRVRLRRQQLLTGTPPLELWIVFDEAVLWRRIGGDRNVHLAQLNHLLHVARTVPTVQLQVMPFEEASHPGMIPSFTVMEFPAPDPPIVHIEGLTRDQYVEEDEARQFMVTHEVLRAAALSQSRSIRFIEWVRDEVARRSEEEVRWCPH